MIPIHELLNRIRWDSRFGAADFEVGYFDRVRQSVVRVPFGNIRFDPNDHFAFQVLGDDGQLRTVPFHRVRRVRRNGVLIWQRGAGARPAARSIGRDKGSGRS